MEFSHAEENYLKAIYHLSTTEKVVSTNAIAEELKMKPASVSDMLKKLSTKKLIHYEKYKGVSLTREGRLSALWIVRKHRLWEVFLVEKLNFNWDEVHEVAEQLEHIHSKRLIASLDQFLGFPEFDPHGDPIPDEHGNMRMLPAKPLENAPLLVSLKVVTVSDSDPELLQYLDKLGISIGSQIRILEKTVYDGSMQIEIERQAQQQISKKVSQNVLVINSD